MSKLLTFVYSEEFQKYNFNSTHPLKPIRLKLTYELAKDFGVFDRPDVMVVEGRLATDEELLYIHSSDYVNAVKEASQSSIYDTSFLEYGIGFGDNPQFQGMHEAASYIAGSSIVAVEAVMEGKAEHAINISGGLHHALRNKAAGFCIYNDPAIAIEYACRKYGIRIVYIDIDAHHGDGVQWAFYDRSDVLTISMHEDGRYLFPGTGFIEEIGSGEGEGFSVNIPLEPGTYDNLYLNVFEEVIPPIVRAYKPDLIVTQNGCDTHYTDTLAGLSLSTNAYEHLYSIMHNLAHELCDGRIVALGGGGYQAYQVVPRAWTLLTANLAHMVLDDYTPSTWQDFCSDIAAFACPVRLRDKGVQTSGQSAEIDKKVKETVNKVKKLVFPYFNLK